MNLFNSEEKKRRKKCEKLIESIFFVFFANVKMKAVKIHDWHKELQVSILILFRLSLFMSKAQERRHKKEEIRVAFE